MKRGFKARADVDVAGSVYHALLVGCACRDAPAAVPWLRAGQVSLATSSEAM